MIKRDFSFFTKFLKNFLFMLNVFLVWHKIENFIDVAKRKAVEIRNQQALKRRIFRAKSHEYLAKIKALEVDFNFSFPA